MPKGTDTPADVKGAAMEALLMGDTTPNVARRAGVSTAAADGWRKDANAAVLASTEGVGRYDPAQTNANIALAAKKSVAQRVDDIRRMYLDRAADPDAIAKTSGFYAVLSAKHLTEVHQLLTGGATHRVEGLFAFLSSYKEGGGSSDPSKGEG